jgi:hypothetical protein
MATDAGRETAWRGPARHEIPAIDDAALVVARHADRLVAAAQASGVTRWEAYLAPLPDRFRDGDLRDVRSAAMRARAAYGPKDSVRDALPAELTEPFLDAVDRLLKAIARRELRSDIRADQ